MMSRRRFSRIFLGALGASTAGSEALWGLSRSGAVSQGPAYLFPGGPAVGAGFLQASPTINGPRLHGWLRELSHFGARADGGVDRMAFTDADLEGRAYVRNLMEDSGLAVRTDVAGNIFGRRPGTDESLPPLMVGSHIDSVPAGGNFDGPLGTLGALEGVRSLQESGIRTRHPIDVVVFVNEEGGKTGSRTMAGEIRLEELNLVSASGFTIGEGIRRLGGNPDRLREAQVRPGDVAGFLELHVEQGATLEEDGIQVGVVEGIVGIRRWNAVVRGAANHAGTTPMDRRQDALLSAARLIQAVNTVAKSFSGSQVATVGRIEALPGAPNVIPGEATLSIEIRALEMARIQEVFEGIEGESEIIGRETGTAISLEEFYLSAAAPTDERFRRWVEGAAAELGLSHRRMPSGAGHDAQAVAHFAPMGMVFVPSVGGLSHHPEEFTQPEDVEAGANVLLGALLRADAGLD